MTPCTECRYASECPHAVSEPPTCLRQGEHPAVALLRALCDYGDCEGRERAFYGVDKYLASIDVLEDEDEE